MGLVIKEDIAEYVDKLRFLVNIMLRKGIPSIKELELLGVARLGFGPAAAYAVFGFLKKASEDITRNKRYDMLLEAQREVSERRVQLDSNHFVHSFIFLMTVKSSCSSLHSIIIPFILASNSLDVIFSG